MRPPKIIKPYVISFCRSIVDAPEPRYIPVRPIAQANVNDCFNVVKSYMGYAEGTQLFGWSIWEWPNVFIEAEFHSIWVSANEEEIDITPKEIPVENILFLPDKKRKYNGYQVDSFLRKRACGKDKSDVVANETES